MFIWTSQIIIALSKVWDWGRATSLSKIADCKRLLNYSFKEYTAVYLVSASLSVPQTKISDKKILLPFYYSQCFFLFFFPTNKQRNRLRPHMQEQNIVHSWSITDVLLHSEQCSRQKTTGHVWFCVYVCVYNNSVQHLLAQSKSWWELQCLSRPP